MSPREAEQYLEDFPFLNKKIFVYKQEFVPNEYVTIERTMDKQFRVTEEKTVDIKDFVDKVTGYVLQDEFKRLLMCEQLKEYTGGWFMNIRDLKTNSCCCGAWVTQNPNNHAFWCRKWTRIG